MPSTPLYDRTGKTVGNVELSDELFAAPVNTAVLHQVVTAQLAGRRTGTHDTKTRGEVRGGGRKPYRQKGTGRARQGTVSAPHYRGGGVVFGPHPRSYEQRLPRKMKRLALRGALTAKLGDEQIKVIDALRARRDQDQGAGRRAAARWRPTAASSSSPPARDQNLELSARNLPTVEVILADSLNVVDLLNADLVLIEQPALARMETRLRQRHAGGGRVSALTAPEIILRPVISEKSIDESGRGKYTFAVHADANKIQIKAAVEELYKKENVTVVAVNVLTTKAKEKRRGTRRGRIVGHTTPWRKAIVTLAPGQKIEFFEGV